MTDPQIRKWTLRPVQFSAGRPEVIGSGSVITESEQPVVAVEAGPILLALDRIEVAACDPSDTKGLILALGELRRRCLMPERNPREWQIRVCACGREQLQGELGAGVCWHHWDPDGEQFLEMDRVYTVEDLGPERMLAWAIDRLRGPDTTLAAERLTGHVQLTLPRGRHIDDGGLDVEITDDGHPVEITWTEKSDDFHGTATRCIVLSESELLTIIAEWAALRGSGDGE